MTLAFSQVATVLRFAGALALAGRTSRALFARFLPPAVCSTSNVSGRLSADRPDPAGNDLMCIKISWPLWVGWIKPNPQSSFQVLRTPSKRID